MDDKEKQKEWLEEVFKIEAAPKDERGPYRRIVAKVHENGQITTESGWFIGKLADLCDYDGLAKEEGELLSWSANITSALKKILG